LSKHTLSGDGEIAQEEPQPAGLKLGIFRDNATGVIFLALLPYTDGKPRLDKMLRLTQTTEEIIDFFQMLRKALEGDKPKSGMYT